MVVTRIASLPTSLAHTVLPTALQSLRVARSAVEGSRASTNCRVAPAAYAEEATSSLDTSLATAERPECREEPESMTPEEAMAVERRLERDAVESMQEYAGMKAQLLGRAQRGAGFLSIYIFLQQGLVAGGCAVAGSLVGYVYLRLMIGEVDRYTADTEVPLTNARQVQSQPLQALAIAFAAYRQALTARLLLPLGLGALVFVINSNLAENFTGMQEFDMLVGFLFTYKAGLFLKLYDDLKPKFGSDADTRPARPTLAALPDIEEDRMERLLRERQRH